MAVAGAITGGGTEATARRTISVGVSGAFGTDEGAATRGGTEADTGRGAGWSSMWRKSPLRNPANFNFIVLAISICLPPP